MKGCHQLPKRGRLKALVWFWIISDNLCVLTFGSSCDYEQGWCTPSGDGKVVELTTSDDQRPHTWRGEQVDGAKPKVKAKVYARVLVLALKTP